MQPPESHAETPEGLLFFCDGISPMKRWDGSSAQVFPVGVTAPATACSLSASGTGAIAGSYFGFVRFVNERGAVSDLSPVSLAVVAASNLTITYSGIPISGQANVTRRQLLRNTAGQANTFYVDIDTTDLGSATLSSTRIDSDLSSREAVSLFDATTGAILANLHGVPPSHKTVIAHHSGRMFAAVDYHYGDGACSASLASASVSGINTRWTASMQGRQLWVVGATQNYLITAVDTAAQILTISPAWAGASDRQLQYVIRPAPAERRLVYYTEAGDAESWPAVDAISLQEDGDEITGLMVMESFLYILCRRHIYRYTFQSDPGVDGFVFLSENRGCVNNRCWLIASGTAYMLDQQGILAFDSGSSKPVSDSVIPLFASPSALHEGPTINWAAQDLFHAADFPEEQTARWFVCLSGETAPRHAVCYDYRFERFWIEEYDRPITSSVTASLEGRRRVMVASGGKTFLLSEGALDGLDAGTGLTRGTATGGDRWGIRDDANYLYWPDGALLVGQSVAIVEGRGSGQRRAISSVAGPRIATRTPFLVSPDSTSVYQLGGVSWEWKSGWLRYIRDEEEQPRKVEIIHRVTGEPASLLLRLYEDFRPTPLVMATSRRADAAEGFASSRGSADLVADMSGQYGQAQQRIDSQKELEMIGPRYLSLGLSGVTGPADQAIYQVSIDGVENPAGQNNQNGGFS